MAYQDPRTGYTSPYADDDYNRSDANMYPPLQQNNDYSQDYAASRDSFVEAPLSSSAAPVAGAFGGGYGATVGARDASNPFSEKYKGAGGGGGKKWWFIGAGVLAVVGIVVGIAVWRSDASKKTSASSSRNGTASTGTSLQYIKGTAGVVKSNPSDPSDFEKDTNLHQVFYGLAYTPFLSQEPWCGITLLNVTEDIQLLSQLTTRLRMYGSGCNQSAIVLQAIEDTKVNMTVWLGAYIGTNDTVNAQQQSQTLEVLQTYGTDHVSGITIGNEYVLDSTDQTTGVEYLVAQMKAFRTALAALNLSKTIPVGTADAGSEITLALAEGSDYFMANVHPFFGGLPIAQAAGWTWEYFTETDVSVCTAATNNPPCYIAETGWPTNSLTVANMTDGAALAGVSELQTFLDTYVCTANTNGTAYFFFEPFDEPWKDGYGGVEPFWGLGDSNKIWKNITFPSC